MTANEIRDSYKKFFESKGHVIVPSAPMVIKDDPTLMFTNAGMNQWKDIILGTKDPEPRRPGNLPSLVFLSISLCIVLCYFVIMQIMSFDVKFT